MNFLGLSFLKVSGNGNDFIVIVNFKNVYDYDWSSLGRILCKRGLSVGADGLVILEDSQKADARMRIFNPDGSEAEMCGNAARCAAKVLVQDEIATSSNVTLETISGIITAQVKDNTVKIKMTKPHSFKDKVHIRIENIDYNGSFINTGVPHTVFFTEDTGKVDLIKIGPEIRYDKQFQPDGTNVNFVQVLGNDSISIRTYERGVENETYACGTGAVASSVVGYLKGLLKANKITVLTKGGELSVDLEDTNGKIENVYLESPVKIIYSAKYLGEGENV
jgi:diaminopimelate epimerase